MADQPVDGTEDARFRDREAAVDAAEQSGKTEQATITCPKCGGEFQNLPLHLPSCDGGAST